MRTILSTLLLSVLLAAACSVTVQTDGKTGRTYRPAGASGSVRTQERAPQPELRYPPARTEPVIEDYHGVMVSDPYRWMEDLDSAETADWVAAENQLTFAYLESIPEREPIRERLTELWNFERYGPPEQRGNRYFYTHNNGLQNQSLLYAQDGLEGEPRVLLDPNTLSRDGTMALAWGAFSESGRYLAYALADAGSDWTEWHVLDTGDGRRTDDHLRYTKFTGATWTHDDAGFFYSRYPEPPPGQELEAVNTGQQLYYHRLGDPQTADTLIYERPDQPTWGFGAEVSTDGRWLLIQGWEGSDRRNRYWYRSIEPAAATRVQPLMTDFDAAYQFLGNDGGRFYFFTDKDAPRGRVVAVDPARPEPANWTEIIPENEDTLRSAHFFGGRLVADYLRNAAGRVVVYGLDGAFQQEIGLPGPGAVSGLSGRHDEPQVFYSFTSFTTPGTVQMFDLATGQGRVHRAPELAFDPSRYITTQVWYTSKDGTRVPMFLTHLGNLYPKGDHPTLLYGYGGFDIPITPRFRVENLAWMEMGGIYASANLRGGGEFGKAWHRAGSLDQKQNTFDDFIAAAEYLIDEGYTSTPKLAISGASNGGLLVGACMTQRPELFGACLPAVGVMDMLRFQKFTIGWAWVSDYGSSDDPEQFAYQYAFSPLHNLQPGAWYPATLITTADHDDRVVPSHSFKFAAALQKAQGGPAPVLIRIETRAGHGAGKPTSKRIEEAADKLAFLVEELGVEAPAP